eukprot:TRINITY_DN8986_c0_g1_i4.p1 TRINITY_DN8986_c0_g1~~TRINITY_DN8986_c0_g1_i4.p1  ORF type:complete len:376 (-),score=74.72 TRINITY_DN8986_c0_g1_i4:187-1314(-)
MCIRDSTMQNLVREDGADHNNRRSNGVEIVQPEYMEEFKRFLGNNTKGFDSSHGVFAHHAEGTRGSTQNNHSNHPHIQSFISPLREELRQHSNALIPPALLQPPKSFNEHSRSLRASNSIKEVQSAPGQTPVAPSGGTSKGFLLAQFQAQAQLAQSHSSSQTQQVQAVPMIQETIVVQAQLPSGPSSDSNKFATENSAAAPLIRTATVTPVMLKGEEEQAKLPGESSTDAVASVDSSSQSQVVSNSTFSFNPKGEPPASVNQANSNGGEPAIAVKVSDPNPPSGIEDSKKLQPEGPGSITKPSLQKIAPDLSKNMSFGDIKNLMQIYKIINHFEGGNNNRFDNQMIKIENADSNTQSNTTPRITRVSKKTRVYLA